MTTHPDKVCPCCGRPIARCEVCGKEFSPVRTDAKTCSVKCRVAKHRAEQKAREEASA